MIQGAGNYVWIKRDETSTEKSGFVIPDQGQEKLNTGVIVSAGTQAIVFDKNLKVKRTAIFPKGSGFEINYKDEVYLVMECTKIIGTDDPNNK